ncbi:MAG: MBL fold metallo-hydrolase [Comamonadaceae bacterium]|nr:MAG: MBL fold metallo-hydrolase [Comamonadaceae bacterium]
MAPVRRAGRTRTTAAAALYLLLAGGCTSVNPYYDPARPHHTREGFKNNYIAAVNKGFGELMRWQWERRRDGLPKPPATPVPVQSPDMAAITSYPQAWARAAASPAQPQRPPAITWIGHASTLVQAGGLNMLTDPVFSKRASPVQFVGPERAQPPGIALADLPPIDVVMVSHNHYDHLDTASVQAIAARSAQAGKPTLFLVPLGLKSWFASRGIDNVIEMDWWDRHVFRGVEFNFTPVQHWSARGLGDRSQTLWGGYAVFAPDLHWYFSGDTGYSKDFQDTRARFAEREKDGRGGFDLALIAVGAYEPRWFMASQHINPAEAVQIHRDLGAKRSVGVHWGTFELTDEPLDQPPKDLAAARTAQGLKADDFVTLAVGETRVLSARQRP